MRSFTHKAGFTLIELMVALAVTGILMAGLVSVSDTMQRAVSRNKEVTELQANLRFAMHTLTEKISRTGFMASPNPSIDSRYKDDLQSHLNLPAISFIESDPESEIGATLALRGNFDSSGDFTLLLEDIDRGRIVCRDRSDFSNCGFSEQGGDPYNLPFGRYPEADPNQPYSTAKQAPFDEQVFKTTFYPGQYLRMHQSINHYFLRKVISVDPANMSLRFKSIKRTEQQGHFVYINPISEVAGQEGGVRFFQMVDPDYEPDFTTENARKWDLIKRELGSDGNLNSFRLAHFLLPPPTGFQLAAYNDSQKPTNLTIDKNHAAWVPSVDYQNPPDSVTSASDVDPFGTRAVIVTLRARTENEDPDFYIEPAAGTENFAIDLDDEPENGMAHVRIEQTVVEIKNTIPSNF